MNKKPDINRLPKSLKIYKDSDYFTQQRAKFLYYLCIAMLYNIVILSGFRIIINSLGVFKVESLLTVFITTGISFLLVYTCYWLLVKGYYSISSYIVPTLIILMIWAILIYKKEDAFIRLDTIVYLFVPISMAPLLIREKKYMILLYSAINILILIIFVEVFRPEFGLSKPELLDYIIDISVSFAFVGFIGYNISSINSNALNSAEADKKKREETEKALRISEKKFREMSLLLPLTVYEADLDGKLTFINLAGYEMFGYSEEDMHKGVNVFMILAEEDRERAGLILKNVIYDNIIVRGNQYIGKKKDGSTFPIQIYTSAIKEGDEIVGFRGAIFDISDRLRAEEELRKSNEIFKTLIESTPISITLTDMDGKVILANKTFCNFLGLTIDEIVGKTASELGIKFVLDNYADIRDQLLAEGCIDNIESTVLVKDVNSFSVYFSGNIVEFNNQKGILQSTIDITEKKKTERELEKYRNQLEQLVKERTEELDTAYQKLSEINKDINTQKLELEKTVIELQNTQEQLIQTEKMASLGILTAGVAHEINNPINYIYNGAAAINDYIKHKSSTDYTELRPYLEAIDTGVKRTTNIIKSLNRYSRADNLSSAECDIHEIIEDCLTILCNEFKNRIEIKKEYYTDIPKLFLNEARMHQALLNILDNAIQAIHDEGIINLKTSIDNDNITVVISDTGEGINEENIKHIFDPFFTTKDPGKGTGLGLSIAYQIINEHDGTINCHSKLNKGTEFILNLPIKSEPWKK
jgi:PAS domain S-box-containing protein